MKHKTRLLSCALFMILLSVSAALAVTVTGNDGTMLGLNQISDIVRHVTGRTSGDLSFNKESLYMFGLQSSGQQHKDVYLFKNDGTNSRAATAEGNVSVSAGSFTDYQSVASVQTSRVRSDDSGKLVLDFAVNNNNLDTGSAFVVPAAASSDLRLDHTGRLRTAGEGITGNLIDAKSGIIAKGYSGGELVAYLMRNGENFSVHLAIIYPGSTPEAAYADTTLASWSGNTGDSGNVPKMLDGTVYFPLSMAVGDFDNDGYMNEIVVVDSNNTSVHYTVLQVTHTGAAPSYPSFAINVLNKGDVGTYNYGSGGTQYTGRCQNMDVFTCSYSACVAAGDFDKDGKTEFAVVYRDTTPSDNNFVTFADNNSLFVGYTGKIHVKTYKWNGSSFQTEEDVQTFDSDGIEASTAGDGKKWNNMDIPLGVKVAAGDFDGDGHDELAVLRVMLQYSEQYSSYSSPAFSYSNFVFGGFVDLYTFDRGSIKPKYNAHTYKEIGRPANYGDNANGWVGLRTTGITMPLFREAGVSQNDTSQSNQNIIRQRYYLEPLTGAQIPYPVIDREFALIAGKFSGQVGTVVPRDDLVIKYPQWASGTVTGNKLRSHVALMTNIPGVTNWGTQVHEISALPERDHFLSFAKADYAGESVHVGEPVKVTDMYDEDYTAILQMFPYHVDNLTADGTALQKDPQNFTLRTGTSVTYNNTSSSSNTKNLNYKMTTAFETIFALDTPALRSGVKTFQGIRGLVTNILGNNDVIKKLNSSVDSIWNKIKDTTETTKTGVNTNSRQYTISMTTAADYQDTLYMNRSTRYFGVIRFRKCLLLRG